MTTEEQLPSEIPVCQLDADGYFVSMTVADLSREDGTYLIPGGCVNTPQPSIPQGKRAKWTGSEFVLEDIPTPPAPVEPPPPTHQQLVGLVLTRTRSQRLPIISILDGLQASAITKGDMPGAQAIETAKQGLRDITTTDLSACTTQAEMEMVIYLAYLAIAAAAPPSVQSAFQSLVP